MGDLISRSALLELFKSLRDEHETSCISYNALYELILQQKTAYDVEAKVAELKKIRDDENCDNVKTEDCLSCKDCNLCLMNRAIEIVRGKE